MSKHFLFLFVTSTCGSTLCAQQGRSFIQNRGQWPEQVTFRAEAPDATIWVESGSVLVDRFDLRAMQELAHVHTDGPSPIASRSIAHHALRMRFLGAVTDPTTEAIGVRPGTFNYFIGNDPSRWASNAHAFSAVTQTDIYPGIDLRLRCEGSNLKYDLLLSPQADPELIRFTYDGTNGFNVQEDEVTIHTSLGALTEHIPLAYQEMDGKRVVVACGYRAIGKEIGFQLGEYDRSLPVVIDPTLNFSTYSGSVADNFGYTATFDQDGFLYSGSTAFGQGYPVTLGAFQVTHAGGDGLFDGTDIALTKYDTTGTFLIWSTYLGGSSDEIPHSLVVNDNDELFVYGTTSSPNFPITANALDPTFNGGPSVDLRTGIGANMPNGVDIFVARLSANGAQLLASTYLGGSDTDGLNTSAGLKFNYADEVRGEVLLDANDNVYIASCTASPDMPVSTNGLQSSFGGGGQDGVLFKLDASLTTIIWGTYYGGSAADAVYNIDLNDAGDIYLAGGTRSTDLSTSTSALFTSFQGGAADGFVAQISTNGSNLIAGTYFGTSGYDQCYFADLDQEGNVYLFGQTNAPGSELIHDALYNVPNSGQFITKLDAALTTSLISTRFGQGDGRPDISPTAFLVDFCDKIYVSGWGSVIQNGSLSTAGMAVTPDAYQLVTDSNDFYLAVFDVDLSALYYGTFFGGDLSPEHVDGGTSRFDRRGRVYQSVCAGCGGNSDFPIQPDPGAWSPTNNSGLCNNGVFKFDFDFPIVVAEFNSSIACLPDPVNFTNTSYGASSYSWNFGDGTTSNLISPIHVFPGPGVYTVTLIANNAITCNHSDTTSRQVVVLGSGEYALPDTSICAGESVQIGILPISNSSVTYQWSPTTGLSNATVANPIATPTSSTTYSLTISNGTCSSTTEQLVSLAQATIDAAPDQVLCGPAPTGILTANGFGSVEQFQWSTSRLFSDTLNTPLTDSTASISPSSTAWYYVRQLDNACMAMDSVLVQVSLSAPGLLATNLICSNDTARLELLGIDLGSTIIWQPDEDILIGQGTTEALVTPTETMTYGVEVTSPLGCTWSGTTTVTVSPLEGNTVLAAAAPTVVLAGESVQLQAFPMNAPSYSWSPANLLDDPLIDAPVATVQTSTTFTVTVSDGICTKDAQVSVEVHDLLCADPDIFVPNTFTPNGDGNNDVLFVRGRVIATLDFKLFDRWGELIFETTDPNIGWDGTFEGRAVDPAVFVYHLTAYCIDGQRYFTKGNVTVVR